MEFLYVKVVKVFLNELFKIIKYLFVIEMVIVKLVEEIEKSVLVVDLLNVFLWV